MKTLLQKYRPEQNTIQRVYEPRQLYYLKKAKATNKMHNKVIKIDDNNLK